MSDNARNQLADDYTAAWNSGDPDRVASYYATDGQIVINRGVPCHGRAEVATMASGFFADIPDMKLACDGIHWAGDHAIYHWTFAGNHASSGKSVRVSGWEEWDITADGLIASSRGWFDADEYARQTAG